MNVDYYALLTKAVAGKDAAARDQVYKDAYGLVRRSNLPREAASSHIVALDEAIRRIEDEIAVEEERSAAAVSEVLSTERNWKPWVVGACALVAAIALSAALYGYVSTRGPSVTSASVAPSSLKPVRGREDVVMADLKPGVDGGSSGEGLPFALQRQVVFYRTTVVPGSIVVDRDNRFLYLVEANNSARRYGIGISREAACSASPTSWNGRTGRLRARTPRMRTRCSRRPAVPAACWERARCCWTSRGCSFTAPTRRKRSATSSRPDASGW
jgi:lipoprotein-anchoring transpeptidase ErfK/SrfK